MKWRQSHCGFYYFLRVYFFAACLEITVIGVWTGIVKVVKNSLAQNCDNILARVAWPSIHQHLQEQLHHHHHCRGLEPSNCTHRYHSQKTFFEAIVGSKKSWPNKSFVSLREMVKCKTCYRPKKRQTVPQLCGIEALFCCVLKTDISLFLAQGR